MVTAVTRLGYLTSNPANLGTALRVASYGYYGFGRYVCLQNLLWQLQDRVRECCDLYCVFWVSLALYVLLAAEI